MTTHERLELIDKVLEIELEMFLAVPSACRSTCQDHPEIFRLHRKSQFAPWSDDTVRSYLQDLVHAMADGRNLMTVKYARMEEIIPRENDSPLIEVIVATQLAWQQDMVRRFPGIMSGGRPLFSAEDSVLRTSFETYLRGELETYSDATLSLLHRDIMERVEHGMNMAEEIYSFLMKEMGYDTLEEAEQIAVQRIQGRGKN